VTLTAECNMNNGLCDIGLNFNKTVIVILHASFAATSFAQA